MIASAEGNPMPPNGLRSEQEEIRFFIIQPAHDLRAPIAQGSFSILLDALAQFQRDFFRHWEGRELRSEEVRLDWLRAVLVL